ncbi:MAG: L,D-transpeptidase [Rhodoblastus sp.]
MLRGIVLFSLFAVTLSGLGAEYAAAQGVTPVWPGQPAYGRQRAPDVYLEDDEYDYSRDYGRPLARPRRGAQGYDDFDQTLTPGRPRQLAPQQRRRATAALPSDADPAYSTAADYDSDIDWSAQTRAAVGDPTGQSPGTITVDTRSRKLYLSLGGGQAMEYGIGVGRQGFAWKGVAQVGRKAFWPGWTPPKEMLLRRPDLPDHMEGGIENPLGARALYLFKGSKDTLFRIHGTNEPDTIGRAVSSGCIRMLNADVVDLYRRVSKGARVVVL